jgi:hypothetical protein
MIKAHLSRSVRIRAKRSPKGPPVNPLDLSDLLDLLDLLSVLGHDAVGRLGVPEPGDQAAAHTCNVLA